MNAREVLVDADSEELARWSVEREGFAVLGSRIVGRLAGSYSTETGLVTGKTRFALVIRGEKEAR